MKTFTQNAKNVVNLTLTSVNDAFQSYFFSSPLRFHEKIANLINTSYHLEQILIVSPQGNIIFNSEVLKGIPTEKEYALPRNIRRFEIYESRNEYLEYIVPILNDRGIFMHSIVYRFSKKPILQFRNLLIITAILMYFTLVVLNVINVTLTTKPIVDNIIKLKRVAENIEKGDLTIRSSISTNDEIQFLSDTFNEMLESIASYIYNLKSMVHELEERDRARQEILARISHEMRTPLTVCLGYVDLLKNKKFGNLTEKQEETINIIFNNLKRLENEVVLLLRSSQMALNAYKVEIKDFDLKQLVEKILENFSTDIKKKALTVETHFEVNKMTSDEEHVYYILSNLISNAIKFASESGNVRISTKKKWIDHVEYFVISIFNTGKTIPEKELPKIFEPFYQIENQEKSGISGVGLGLYIVKRSVEVLKGQIEVNNWDNGVEFIVYLPEFIT
ncbi:MAG: ATP-binding protein [Candidatus Hydrothermia bacterium]